MRWMAVFVSLVSVWAAGPAFAAPEVSVDTKYERFRAIGFDQVLDALKKIEARYAKSGGFLGEATAEIRYDFKFRQSGDRCQVSGHNVRLDIVYRMPSWLNANQADQDLQERWNRFWTALQGHEKQHGLIGLEAAKEIDQVFVTAPPMSCGEIEKTLTGKAKAILDQMDLKNKNYDKKTNHGETEGAVFR